MKREVKRRDHHQPKKAKAPDLPQHVQETYSVVLSHPVCGAWLTSGN